MHVDGVRRRRVALLEDHGLIAQTLAAALDARGIAVEVIDPATVADPVGALTATGPELALLDLDLGPNGDSIGLIGPLASSGVPVLIVTGVRDAVQQARCVAAGAVGVLSKSGSFEDLVASIERALDRGSLLDAQQREQHLALLRAHAAAERDRLAPFEQLTRREAEVLGGLMRGRSVEQIATASVVSVTTVRSHVRGVLTKLGVSSQLAATARAAEAGWQPPAED